MSNHMWGAFITTVNKDKWDSLPPQFRSVARKHINAGNLLMRGDFTVLEKDVRGRLTRDGLVFNEVDRASFRTKLMTSGFYQRWRDEWGPIAWGELEKYSGPLT